MIRLAYLLLLAFVPAVITCRRQEPARVLTPSATQPAAQYDVIFIDTALKHHAEAVEMASMAQSKARRSELAALATSIIDQTDREMKQLRAWRDRWYSGAGNAYQPDFPGALSMKMDYAPLQRDDAGDWDAVFVELMVPHQEAMITMATDAQQKATQPELRQFAAGMIPVLQRDVTRMREWEGEWRR